MFNFKLIIPDTLLLGVVAGLFTLSYLLGAIVFGLAEAIVGILVFHKMSGESAFQYTSFYGRLLSRYTSYNYIDVEDFLQIICARITSAVIAVFAYIFTPWLYIPSIVLLLLTVIHKKAQ